MAVFALAFLVSALIVFVDRKLVTRLSKSEPEA
jgi:hypothetical protein